MTATDLPVPVDRDAIISALARHWWDTQTDDTDLWDDLTPDEQANVIENSFAAIHADAVLALPSGRSECMKLTAENDRLRKIVRRQERVIEGYETSVWTDRAQAELGALRAVVDRVRKLHEPDSDGVCPVCAEAVGGGWDVVPVKSPCPTLVAAAW